MKSIVVSEKRVSKVVELSREKVAALFREAGIPIPEGCEVSVRDPGVIPGFEDPPPDAPIEIRWMEVS